MGKELRAELYSRMSQMNIQNKTGQKNSNSKLWQLNLSLHGMADVRTFKGTQTRAKAVNLSCVILGSTCSFTSPDLTPPLTVGRREPVCVSHSH